MLDKLSTATLPEFKTVKFPLESTVKTSVFEEVILMSLLDFNGTKFSISKNGVLSYKNVSYQMQKNANVTVKDLTDHTSEDFFSLMCHYIHRCLHCFHLK